jgi:hypothetical protein
LQPVFRNRFQERAAIVAVNASQTSICTFGSAELVEAL